jgi:acyl-CoA synthetase (AMP-forming)/AMP-acid ligase II
VSSFSYAAAALSQDLWDRLEAVSVRTIGVPVPGVEIKLVPTGAKQELRVRGPNVTPGYLGRPDLTEQAFDEDGFYRTGDARPCASMTVIPMSPRSVLFDMTEHRGRASPAHRPAGQDGG